MAQQQLRNFQLFDVPVDLFFTVNRAMGIVSKINIAIMMQNVMVTGLDTCPEAVWNDFHAIVLSIFGVIALDYADPEHIGNSFITPRVAVEEFAVF